MDNMPSIGDLSTIYGAYSPEMYTQGRRQIGLSNQFQDEALAQSQQKTAQDTLATQFKTQNNPQLLEAQNLANQGAGFENMSKGAKGRFDVATEGFKLDEAKRQQALALPEHEIKMMQAKGQQMAYSDDPNIQAQGKRILQLSAAAIEARQKHADEMEKQDVIRKSAERVAGIHAGATLGAAKINAESRKAAKVVDPNMVAAKLGYEKGAAYYAIQAENTDDPMERNRYLEMAKRFEQANLQQKAASGTGKLDVGAATGMPTVQPNLVLGGGSQQTPTPQQAPQMKAPPQGAIQMLQSNPALAAQFDAKYGQGASAQFLGK